MLLPGDEGLLIAFFVSLILLPLSALPLKSTSNPLKRLFRLTPSSD